MGTIVAKKNHPAPILTTGSFTVTNQAVPTNSTWLLQVALGRSDYKQGYLIFYQPNSLVSLRLRRKGVFITFSTVASEAISRANGVNYDSVYGYTVEHQWVKGYSYRVDSVLSDYVFSTVGAYIRINSCRINGSNLEIEFQCTGTGRLLSIEGQYYVQR